MAIVPDPAPRTQPREIKTTWSVHAADRPGGRLIFQGYGSEVQCRTKGNEVWLAGAAEVVLHKEVTYEVARKTR